MVAMQLYQYLKSINQIFLTFLCIWQTLLLKTTSIFTFLSVLAFPGNRTHDLSVASANNLLFEDGFRQTVRPILVCVLLMAAWDFLKVCSF